MLKRKLFAGVLAASLLVTAVPAIPQSKAAAADVTEIEIEKTKVSNPIGGYDTDGNLIYGGDPSILVDGDTVYLYTGHDTAKTESYEILEWLCYSTKDLENWTYEGVVMKADKASITWANTGTDAWAGQVAKYNDKYYFYYCTWDATAAGKQSIGVAVSDSPTGPFTDIGEPLVKGTVTTPETSTWNDIDPTVWIEKDETGEEHRYLMWGNGKYYTCELNEDMISVKDLNGDGKITSGSSKETADIIDGTGLTDYTEAPYIYRRSDENGNYYGPYYMFYAYKWREEMAYATTDDLLSGKWTFGSQLMPPAATSNTNHPAVFDFNGKTYFIYHNGSLPGGSGFRRSACIAELHFNEDGTIQQIPETAVGIVGKTSKLYSEKGGVISHENFVNSSADGAYPYSDVKVGAGISKYEEDAEWAIVAGKADKTKASYVSIQSENKPGLYLTVNDDKSVVLAQDADQKAIEETAKKQTFRTVAGLNNADGVSFESVSQPGYYLTVSADTMTVTDGSDKSAATFYIDRDVELEERLNARFDSAKVDEKALEGMGDYEMKVTPNTDNVLLVTRDKTEKDKTLKVTVNGEVLLDTATTVPVILNENLKYADQKTKEQIQVSIPQSVVGDKESVKVTLSGDAAISGSLYTRRAYSDKNSVTKIVVNGEELTQTDGAYSLTVPYSVNSINLTVSMEDANGYLELNGAMVKADAETSVAISGKESTFKITAVAEDYETVSDVVLKVKKDYAGMKLDGLAYAFGFENKTDGVTARTKAFPPALKEDASYKYTDGVFGKAIVLDGTYGLKLCDAKELGKSYTLSFWMKPDKVGGTVDPTMTAGTFSPEYWLSLTFDAKIWSNQTGGPSYVATGAANAYKAGQWQHVAVVVDGTQTGATSGTVSGKLFVNGELVSSGDVADGIMTNKDAAVYFGVNGWDAYFTGALDEVMLFNQALTNDEIGAIAEKSVSIENAGKPAFNGNDEENTNKATVKKVVITKKGSSKAVKTLTLKKGKTVKLAAKVTVSGSASKAVTWKTSNKKVATVTAKGVVKAKKKGTVKITAVSKADSKKKCVLKIKVK